MQKNGNSNRYTIYLNKSVSLQWFDKIDFDIQMMTVFVAKFSYHISHDCEIDKK